MSGFSPFTDPVAVDGRLGNQGNQINQGNLSVRAGNVRQSARTSKKTPVATSFLLCDPSPSVIHT